jgi:hypothetical protein
MPARCGFWARPGESRRRLARDWVGAVHGQ